MVCGETAAVCCLHGLEVQEALIALLIRRGPGKSVDDQIRQVRRRKLQQDLAHHEERGKDGHGVHRGERVLHHVAWVGKRMRAPKAPDDLEVPIALVVDHLLHGLHDGPVREVVLPVFERVALVADVDQAAHEVKTGSWDGLEHMKDAAHLDPI